MKESTVFVICFVTFIISIFATVAYTVNSDDQVKIAKEKTLVVCYEAAKVNPSLKCN